MITDEQKIKCPKCGESISIDDVLTHQIGEKIRKEIEVEQKLKEKQIKEKEKALEEEPLKFEEIKKNTQIEINKKVAEKLISEKSNLWKQAKEEAEKQKMGEIKLLEEQMKDRDEKLTEANKEALKARADRNKLEEERKSFELEKIKQIEDERKKIEEEAYNRAVKQSEGDSRKLLKQIEETEKEKEEEKKMFEEQIADKDIKLREANKNELELRKEKQKLKDEKDAFELEKTRQLDEERKKIEEEASKKATEAQQSKIDQMAKQISDATKANEELKRKLEQGSQQTQGEVQEIKLEELLKGEFIQDDISPVPKGVNGADVIQTVKTKNGIECGKIIWESKKTKSWSEGWIQKLKDDQRSIKADIAVIVSSVLPEGVTGISLRDGVWVCDIKLALSIATALRQSLEAVSREKAMSVGKNEKMEILYAYLTGTEFKQRIEVIVETFSSMKSSLDKEKIYFEKSWAEKEKQIQKVIKNTVGIYGDMGGIVQLQKIESLELPEPLKDRN
jgi:hypothetical protein